MRGTTVAWKVEIYYIWGFCSYNVNWTSWVIFLMNAWMLWKERANKAISQD
ncbi:MAG: hypothetical protein QXH58_02385 [Nitrososphaerales archaeon]